MARVRPAGSRRSRGGGCRGMARVRPAGSRRSQRRRVPGDGAGAGRSRGGGGRLGVLQLAGAPAPAACRRDLAANPAQQAAPIRGSTKVEHSSWAFATPAASRRSRGGGGRLGVLQLAGAPAPAACRRDLAANPAQQAAPIRGSTKVEHSSWAFATPAASRRSRGGGGRLGVLQLAGAPAPAACRRDLAANPAQQAAPIRGSTKVEHSSWAFATPAASRRSRGGGGRLGVLQLAGAPAPAACRRDLAANPAQQAAPIRGSTKVEHSSWAFATPAASRRSRGGGWGGGGPLDVRP